MKECVEEAEDVADHAPRGAEAGSAEERWTLVEQSPAAFAGSALARRALLRTLLKTPLKTLFEDALEEAVERCC